MRAATVRTAIVNTKGILFDKDGTLVDFFATWVPAYRAATDLAGELMGDPALGDRLLRLGGYDPATGELDPTSLLAGGTTAEISDLWTGEAGPADGPDFARRMHAAMDDYASRFPVPIGAGTAELFKRLAGRGLALGLATMDSEAVARATAAALGFDGSLSFLCGYDSGYGVKPEAGMVLGFCAATGLAPAEVLVVGDTDRDMMMARAAGAGLAVGVLTGATPREPLEALADHVIASVLDIETILPAAPDLPNRLG
jgi:phosphoglycolate phosphatase